MTTRGSMVFACTFEQAQEVAELADLRHEITGGRSGESYYPRHGDCEQWQDVQTGGGGCRICWKAGVAWVTRHSGYNWADMTEDVADLFRCLGCKEAVGYAAGMAHPLIYGVQAWRDHHGSIFSPGGES